MSGVVSVGWRFACQTSGRINNACSSVGVCLRAARCWWLRICLFYALPQFGHTMLASLPVAQHSLTEAVRSYGKLYKFISASCVQPINSDPMPRNSQCLVLGVGRAGGRTDRRAGGRTDGQAHQYLFSCEQVVMYTSMSIVEMAISFISASLSLFHAAYSFATLLPRLLLGSTLVISTAVSHLRE
jgi:hypothetical protein